MSPDGAAAGVSLEGLTKSYGRNPALIQFTRSIGPAERLILAGPNGAGKSTLLRLIAGLIGPTEGTIVHPPNFRARLGYLDHRSFLYPQLTGAENLRFFAGLYDVAGEGCRLLEQVGLADRADALVAGYSRGMRQRLSLARALLPDPELLLLDEPFTGLDEQGVGLLQSLLRDWLDRGPRTLLVASHDFERLIGLADTMLVLRAGRLAREVPLAGLDADGLRASYRSALETAE